MPWSESFLLGEMFADISDTGSRVSTEHSSMLSLLNHSQPQLGDQRVECYPP
jgi:hypothetical protein